MRCRGLRLTNPGIVPIRDPMSPKDVYDTMPDGAAQRRRNKQRLAELEREGALRRARLAQVVNFSDLRGQVVLPACPHTL
jgi:hypothetical protein